MKSLIQGLVLLLLSLYSFHTSAIEVIKLQGKALVDNKELAIGATLKQGVTVTVVGEKSFIQLRFEDGSMVLQKEGSLTLKKIKKGQTLLSLIKGIIFVYKNPDADSKLNVKTKQTVMAVRGTKFYVEQTDKTYLCVCEGVVAARNKEGTIDVLANEDLYAKDFKSLEKKEANKMMLKMAYEGFELMGVPVSK
jgi:ferric-dicitrate binding protein FerR (iron transport regulator)